MKLMDGFDSNYRYILVAARRARQLQGGAPPVIETPSRKPCRIAQDEIKAGSIVQLKSGGPHMTVAWVQDEDGEVSTWCDWFVQDKAPWKKEGSRFPISSLKLLEP